MDEYIKELNSIYSISREAAAKSAGCSEKTIYNRMKDDIFLEEYRAMQDSVLEITVNNLSGKAADAITTLEGIMRDEDISANVRRAAAVDILSVFDKLTNRLYERRKDAGEDIDIEDSDAYFAAAEGGQAISNQKYIFRRAMNETEH